MLMAFHRSPSPTSNLERVLPELWLAYVSAKAGVWGNPNDSNQFLVRLYYKSYSRNFFTNFLSYLFLAEKFFPNNGNSSLYSSEFQKFIMVKKIIKDALSCRWQFLATERLLKMKKKVSKSLHLKSLNPHLKSFFFSQDI